MAIGLIVAAAFLIVKTILLIVGARTDIGIDWFGFLSNKGYNPVIEF